MRGNVERRTPMVNFPSLYLLALLIFSAFFIYSNMGEVTDFFDDYYDVDLNQASNQGEAALIEAGYTATNVEDIRTFQMMKYDTEAAILKCCGEIQCGQGEVAIKRQCIVRQPRAGPTVLKKLLIISLIYEKESKQ